MATGTSTTSAGAVRDIRARLAALFSQNDSRSSVSGWNLIGIVKWIPLGYAFGSVIDTLHVDASEVAPRIPFGDAQRLGVRVAIPIEPRTIGVAVALHHQHVAVPPSDRVAHPRRIGIRFQRPAIHEDVPMHPVVELDRQQRRCLHEAHGSVSGGEIRRTERKAAGLHAVLAEFQPPLPVDRVGPRRHVAGPQVHGDVVVQPVARVVAPQAREIGLAVGRAWRGRGEIRLAVWPGAGCPASAASATGASVGRPRRAPRTRRTAERPHARRFYCGSMAGLKTRDYAEEQMPRLIERPTVVQAAGNKPKQIQEFVGRVNSGHDGVSVARMVSPGGWVTGTASRFRVSDACSKGWCAWSTRAASSTCARDRRWRRRRASGSVTAALSRRRRVHRRVPAGVLAGHGAPRLVGGFMKWFAFVCAPRSPGVPCWTRRARPPPIAGCSPARESMWRPTCRRWKTAGC